MTHIFDRGGLAAISDCRNPECQSLFDALAREQSGFLEKESQFRSPEYKWPRDPLRNWSRAWEYPYAYHHLRAFRERWSRPVNPVVVDVGSGVTFFPFSVARLGCDVMCTDIDPVCER